MARATPASWLIGVIVAFCAVLLLKWLAVVAVAAVVIFAFVHWARGGWDDRVTARNEPVATRADRPAESTRSPFTIDDPDLPAQRTSSHDDCTWCGLRGGHRDHHGRPVRPRHAHAAA